MKCGFLKSQRPKITSGKFGGYGKMEIKPFAIPEEEKSKWLDAFMKFVNIIDNGCWEWQDRIHQHKWLKGKPGYKGYPTMQCPGGNSKWAHRVAYALFHGPIAANMHIDHRCRNTVCVNPDHLQQVTPQENTAAIYRRKRRDLRNEQDKVQTSLW